MIVLEDRNNRSTIFRQMKVRFFYIINILYLYISYLNRIFALENCHINEINNVLYRKIKKE